ncbi:MAG: hypothetical protein CME06_10155 [Gemmatimonadetes bacterium]|nr:hypothetical protein [Gemmatimonadota bacterium]
MRLSLIALLLCAGCGGATSGDPPAAESERIDDAINVRVEAVRREAISSIYLTSATLRADKRATIIARTRGVVRELRVEEGDRVEAADALALLEDDAQRIEARRTASSLENEEREFDRAERLFGQELLSAALHQSAQRELEEARHAAAAAELELGRTLIKAPFSGRILRRYLDVGATVADGTPVYDIADLDPLYADVDVPERQLASLAPGQAVLLVADASGDSADATIERIAPEVEPTTGTVKITLAVETERKLRPGAFVRVEIVTETHFDGLVVPRSALVANGSRWNLYRLDESGEGVEQLDVVLGFEEGDRIEIFAVNEGGALEPGQAIVVLGASALTQGARVRVIGDETVVDPAGEEAEEPAGESA